MKSKITAKFIKISIVIIVVILVALTIFIIITLWNKRNSEVTNNFNTLPTPNFFLTDTVVITNQQMLKEYIYNNNGTIKPKVSVRYPINGWVIKEDLISGGIYDFILNQDNYVIKLDLSGLEKGNFKNAAIESLTGYGSKPQSLYNLSKIESGNNPDSLKYEIYQINNGADLIAILEIPDSKDSRSSWYVFITINDDNINSTLSSMISSVKSLD